MNKMYILQFNLDKYETGFTLYKDYSFDPDMNKAFRLYPHRHNCEGFFIIKLIKTERQRHVNDQKLTNTIPTISSSDFKIKKDLQQISSIWGIPEIVWDQFRYIRTRERIWMTARVSKFEASLQFLFGTLPEYGYRFKNVQEVGFSHYR